MSQRRRRQRDARRVRYHQRCLKLGGYAPMFRRAWVRFRPGGRRYLVWELR